MSDKIQFDEENKSKSKEVFGSPKKPGMVNWLQKKGLVKSDKTAHYILLAVIVICFGLVGILLAREFGSTSNGTQESLTEMEILQLPENDFRRIQYERNN